MQRWVGKLQSALIAQGSKILTWQPAYDAYQSMVGGVSYRNRFISKMFKEFGMNSVVDLGCGTGAILNIFEDIEKYVGLDISDNYLEKAKRVAEEKSFDCRFKNVVIGQSGWSSVLSAEKNTTGIALGLYHHLPELNLRNLLSEFFDLYGSTAHMISVDPVIEVTSKPIARWFAENDRGEYVRSANKMKDIVKSLGLRIEFEVKTREFRIPLDTIEARIFC